MIKIALAGNPNCGKSSLFNVLTKARQHIGNWPGVTVEKKEGILKHKDKEYKVIDLPGTYSLGAYSEDEIVARDYLIKDKPDVVINVLDSTNLERNLYLTTQLIEAGAEVVLALNMIDLARNKNIKINAKELSKRLNVPVVEISALRKEGIDNLIDESINIRGNAKKVKYDEAIESGIKELEEFINLQNKNLKYPSKWLAIKLLENDKFVSDYLEKHNMRNIIETKNKIEERITNTLGFEPEMAIVDGRYNFISEITDGLIKKPSEEKESFSDKLDKVLTNRILGIPIFLGVMYLLYSITFWIGASLQDMADGAIGSLGETVGAFLTSINTPEFLVGLVTDGIFAGVGAVISFVPLIMVMYFLIGILEDSGYMARGAYVMDRVMRALGLHGKTFVSMIISGGCNVPGIMSTRTLESKKDRMIAILINPFVSCGARLPIYAVFIDAFFQTHSALILLVLYTLGIIIALIVGKILSKTLFKGETSYFVMELPSYKIPSIKNVLILTWEKGAGFVKKAGTIILPAMIVLWVLSVLPYGVEQYSADSVLGKIGSFIAPIFVIAGFGTWQASVALFTGVIAKEAVVGTLGMLYAGVEEGAGLTSAIGMHFTPLSAMSFMIMTLLYTPCLAALGAVKRETNSTKWTIFVAVMTFLIALVVSTIVYRVGLLLGFN